jgi:CheY-like chemotaxis protein
VLPHIFEPFFTTKEPGRGTGLGLAMVYGIVQQHQGWVEGHNEPCCGACFDVYLPCCCQERAAPEPVPHPPPHGNETLLLADDEPLLRSLAHTILHRFGYEILLAADGAEVLEIYQRERHRIDLVILDLTMPRISGREAFRRLRELDPEVRVLFASGFAGEQILPSEREHVLGFVSKPFRPADLVQAVRAALEKANGKNKGQEGHSGPLEPSERAGSQ